MLAAADIPKVGLPRRLFRVRSLLSEALAATCYAQLLVFERRLEEPIPEIESSLELEFSPLGSEEGPAYAALLPDTSIAHASALLRSADFCFAARHRTRLIAVSRALSGTVRIPYLRSTLRLGADEVLTAEAFVAPDVRGRGVRAASIAYELRLLRKAGYRRSLTMIHAENAAGLRVVEKLGYRQIGHVRGLGVGPFRRAWFAGCG